MNNSLSKLIFIVGANFRNPGLFKKFQFLNESQFWSKERLSSYQDVRFNDLVSFIKKHSHYYSEILTQKEYTKSKLKSIPILDKKELLEFQNDITTKYQFKKVIVSETSGSTGQAFKFNRNLEWDTMNRASLLRYYKWYNVSPWERNGYFWGYSNKSKNKFKTKVLDFLQNRFRLFSYDEDEVISFVRKLKKATYLHGYSSMIYEVALKAIELGYSSDDFPKLKMIKGTSEKIFPFYQDIVKKAFGRNIISEYGAAESGIIAFECPQGHMHVNEENVIVEEKNGEIIITNLNSFSFPIIRYKLGDAVKLAPYSICSCGRKSDIITEVLGRVGKNIFGKTKKFPSLTLYYIFKNISFEHNFELQYQGYQNKKGELILRFPEYLSDKQKRIVQLESVNYFKGDVDIILKENVEIHTKDKKLKDFISDLE